MLPKKENELKYVKTGLTGLIEIENGPNIYSELKKENGLMVNLIFEIFRICSLVSAWVKHPPQDHFSWYFQPI